MGSVPSKIAMSPLILLASAVVALPAEASSHSIRRTPGGSDRASVRVVDGVLRFHGSDGKDEITYGQAGRRFEMLSPRPIDPGHGCRRVPPGNGDGAFFRTPYWIVCTHIQSTRWILMDGDDQLVTSKFMPGPYYRASAPSVMLAGAGDDHISGWQGHDVLVGGPGNDRIDGGYGQDEFFGGAGDDHMGIPSLRLNPPVGSPGETFHGGPGNDGMQGGDGNDILFGGGGNDLLGGGSGDDRSVGGPGGDTINGGGGTADVIDYRSRTAAISVTDDGVANDGEARDGDKAWRAGASGSARGTEIVQAGSGNDTISMSGTHQHLHGNAGNDQIASTSGPGSLSGGPGDDTLTISGAPARLRGGIGDDSLSSSDASVDHDGCGPGTDDVTADASDVVNANCESVTVAP